jgi:hypothetical protein
VEEHDHQDEEVVEEPKQPQHACTIRNIGTLVHSWIRSHWRVRKKEIDSYFQEGCRLGSGHRLRSGPPTKFESASVSGSCSIVHVRSVSCLICSALATKGWYKNG